MGMIALALCGSLSRGLWAHKASRHHLGTGLEKGIDDTVIRRVLGELDTANDDPAYCMLLSVLTAAVWPRARQHAAGYDVSP